jgi:histidyl-tRNA synthetase
MHGAGGESWGGMKSQFKRADLSGAKHAIIFGADELSRGEVAVKSLRDPSVPQRSLKLADVPLWAVDLRTA